MTWNLDFFYTSKTQVWSLVLASLLTVVMVISGLVLLLSLAVRRTGFSIQISFPVQHLNSREAGDRPYREQVKIVQDI